MTLEEELEKATQAAQDPRLRKFFRRLKVIHKQGDALRAEYIDKEQQKLFEEFPDVVGK